MKMYYAYRVCEPAICKVFEDGENGVGRYVERPVFNPIDREMFPTARTADAHLRDMSERHPQFSATWRVVVDVVRESSIRDRLSEGFELAYE